MRSKLLAVGVSVFALAVPATASASGSDTSPPGGAGSGGSGQSQLSAQTSKVLQGALSGASATQNAVNTNAPVNVAGGDVHSGSNSASQTATNNANSSATNNATTNQTNTQTQDPGSPSSALQKSGHQVGSGGSGQAQKSSQAAKTLQLAGSTGHAKQNAVNGNSPSNSAGGDVNTGDNSASQTATNSGDSSASQQRNHQPDQHPDAVKRLRLRKGCGGSGQAQSSSQHSNTLQRAGSKADAKQNAVNGNSPSNTAGGDIYSGDNTREPDRDQRR